MSETTDSKDIKAEKELFNVSNIFSKRNSLERPSVDTNATELKVPPSSGIKDSKPNPEMESQSPESDNNDEEAGEDNASSSAEQDKVDSKTIDYQKEIEKLNKTLKDTQRSFHEDRKKLSAYKKAVEKLKAEGTLLDEEANLLLDHTKFESEAENDTNEPTLNKYARIWDREIEYMRKYSANAEDINQSIYAFQHLIQSCSDKERQDIMDDLSQYEDNEVELTKQMIQMGRQYNDEIYSDINKAGGIRKLKSILYKREEELQKKVDKLQNQYDNLKKKYEDYDSKPGGRIPSGSSNNNLQKQDATFDVSKIFASRYSRH
jgi:hypothetical protein